VGDSGRMGGFSADFERFAGWSSILAGIAGFGYALCFVVLKDDLLSGLSLLLAPLFAVVGLVAVWGRLRAVDAGFAALALGFGFIGAIGAATHGAYGLANALQPPPTTSPFPNAIDPRGFMTFGLNGLALLILAWLAGRGGGLPSWVSSVGTFLGAVLIVTWLGRLIVLDAKSLFVLGPALIAGVLSPLFYLGLGSWLLGWRR